VAVRNRVVFIDVNGEAIPPRHKSEPMLLVAAVTVANG
jgi:hypothetical protein